MSERLSHATIAITLDLYSHVLPDMQEEAALKLGLVMATANKRRSIDGNPPAEYPANTGSPEVHFETIRKRPIRAHGMRRQKSSE